MKQLIIILNAIVILLCSILLLLYNNGYDADIQLASITLSIVPIVLYFIHNNRIASLKGLYLRTSYIFLLGYIIVFFQLNLDLILCYVSPTNSVFANPVVINKCSLLSVIGLCSYFIGNAIAINKDNNFSLKQSFKHSLPRRFLVFQSALLSIFTLLYLFFNAVHILNGDFIYSEDTMSEKAGSLSNYSSVMVLVLTFTRLASNAFNIKYNNEKLSFFDFLKSNGLLFNISVFMYIAFIFMTGDRGPIITIVLAHAITYVTISRKKIKLSVLVLFILTGGLFITAIGEIRKSTNLLTLSDILLYKGNNVKQSILPITSELAGSYGTFTNVVKEIPESHDYFYGVMQLRELVCAVPFLYRFIPFVFSSKDYENSSSSYCTYLIQGANRTYGNGSSILADLYIDFGYVGIVVFMFIIGHLVVKFDYELYFGRNIYWQMAAVVFFSFSIYISRATLTTPLYYMIPSFIIMFSSKLFKS